MTAIFDQVVIVPTYNEEHSIGLLIGEFFSYFESNTFFVFVDDSDTDQTKEKINLSFNEKSEWKSHFHIIRNESKNGRGHAVRQGMLFARAALDPDLYIEMDSDGSHNVLDALSIFRSIPIDGYVIGSRYLVDSKILGWAKSRLFYSRLINIMLRAIFRLKISDWTNGMRGYSRNAVNILVDQPQLNTGFIYLAEEILVLHAAKVPVREIPITFKERIAGKSSVTYVEIIDSIKGIFLLKMNKRI